MISKDGNKQKKPQCSCENMVHYPQNHYQAWPELSIDTSVDTVILDISKKVEGHLNPGLINPKFQHQTFQPRTFEP